MRVNSFSVLVPEGRERDSGHVELNHNTVYSLKLGNHDSNRDCDALVRVDGKEVGGFRIRAGCTMVLERPGHDDGRFTFFEANSQQGTDAGAANVVTSDRGLIQVVFKPERKRTRQQIVGDAARKGFYGEEKTCGGLRSLSSFAPQNVSAGVTGLTGKSGQQFVNVPELDYEPNQEVTISVRLVCGRGIRELTSTPRSNEVPVPV